MSGPSSLRARITLAAVLAVALSGVAAGAALVAAVERDGEDGGDRDARAQAGRRAHARITQPTPRTVWSIRGSPPASSLRRT